MCIKVVMRICKNGAMIKQRPTTCVHLIHPMQVHKFLKSTILSSINRVPDLSKERRQVGHTSRTLPSQESRAAIKGHEMNVHLFVWRAIDIVGNGERKAACWMHSWSILTRADHWPDNVYCGCLWPNASSHRKGHEPWFLWRFDLERGRDNW